MTTVEPLTPQVSCVIPLYNKRAVIARAVNSVLGQKPPVSEIIVVDDGSTDGSAEVVGRIADQHPSVRLVRQTNAGASSARNRGVSEARHDWVCFLDGDDAWRPNYCSMLAEMLRSHPDASVLSVGHVKHDGPGRRARRLPPPSRDVQVIRRPLRIYRRHSGLIHSSTACVRRQAFLEAGGFCEAAHRGEDIAFWLALFVHHPLVHAETVCVDRYVSAGAVSRSEMPHHLAYWPSRLQTFPVSARADMRHFLQVSALRFWGLALRQHHLALARQIAGVVSTLSPAQAALMRLASGLLQPVLSARAPTSVQA